MSKSEKSVSNFDKYIIPTLPTVFPSHSAHSLFHHSR